MLMDKDFLKHLELHHHNILSDFDCNDLIYMFLNCKSKDDFILELYEIEIKGDLILQEDKIICKIVADKKILKINKTKYINSEVLNIIKRTYNDYKIKYLKTVR